MPIQHIQILRGERDNETVQLVESSPLPPWGKTAEFNVVGQPVPRVEGMVKVAGRACYASDIRLPGQLYAHVLRSPYPQTRTHASTLADLALDEQGQG